MCRRKGGSEREGERERERERERGNERELEKNKRPGASSIFATIKTLYEEHNARPNMIKEHICVYKITNKE